MKIYKFYIQLFLCLAINFVTLGKQPTTLFCHGILDTKNQINRYQEFLQKPKLSFDFPDAQQPIGWNFNNLLYTTFALLRNQPLNREKMYMGYGTDVQTLKNQISPHESYILFGFSRGGTAAINYLAHNDATNIKALILNATPADTVSAVDAVQKAIGYTFATTRISQELLFQILFPAYQVGSMPSKDAIIQIKNKHLPIFIVHAKTDTVVPINAAWQLYLACKQAGFTDVYLCQLESGQHKAYHKSPDKLKFLQDLHSFYKKYNFDYNPAYGIFDDLSYLQPSMDTIAEKLANYQNLAQVRYQQQNIFNNKISSIGTLALLAASITLLKPYYWHDAQQNPQS